MDFVLSRNILHLLKVWYTYHICDLILLIYHSYRFAEHFNSHYSLIDEHSFTDSENHYKQRGCKFPLFYSWDQCEEIQS